MKENNANAILKKIFKEAVREELQSFIPQLMNEMKHIHISNINPQVPLREQYGQPFGVSNQQYHQHQQPQYQQNQHLSQSIFGSTSNQTPMMNVNALGGLANVLFQNGDLNDMSLEPDYEN